MCVISKLKTPSLVAWNVTLIPALAYRIVINLLRYLSLGAQTPFGYAGRELFSEVWFIAETADGLESSGEVEMWQEQC